MGYHFLLQGIFLGQGSNLGLPHCGQILCHLSPKGSPCNVSSNQAFWRASPERGFPSLECSFQRDTYLSYLMRAPQTDEHYRHDRILGEFTLILGWVLLGSSIAILPECNPYPLCTQRWDQRYWRPALKCRSHSFQEKNILSLNHFRSGLACCRVGQWRGGGKSWPRTGVNFMDQGWNPVHTPVVESELSPTWNYIQIASPEYVGPSLWPPPDRERKEDVDMVWPRSPPSPPPPTRYRESCGRVAEVTVNMFTHLDLSPELFHLLCSEAEREGLSPVKGASEK